MASNLTKAPVLRALAARAYSQLAPVSGTTNYDVKTDVLPNKIKVVSAENESPIARVSIVIRAGCRNESSDNLGVAHVLRICAGLSTKNATQFIITRKIQQVGASLSATSDREVIAYTLEGTRSAVEQSLPLLTEVVSQQLFKPWEVADQTDRLKLELAVRPLQLRAVDLLHKAAYRRALGNSLFVPKFQIGKISTETLQHYVASNFRTGQTAVVGLGFDHSELVRLAQCLTLAEGQGEVPKSPYRGGELRSDKGGDLAFVAIAGEAAGRDKPKEALAAAVLQKSLCSGPPIPHTSIDNGLLNKTLVTSCNDAYAASGISVSYADTGLVGVLLAAPSRSAAKLVEGAVKALKSGSVSDADVQRGKNQLKTSVLLRAESGANAVRLLGIQALLSGSAQSPKEIAEVIDSITTSEVSSALQKAARKLSIASVGNLNNVPYADEILR